MKLIGGHRRYGKGTVYRRRCTDWSDRFHYSTGCTLCIVWQGYRIVADKFRFLDDMLSFIPVKQHFKILLRVGLILGVGIGYVGSRVNTAPSSAMYKVQDIY